MPQENTAKKSPERKAKIVLELPSTLFPYPPLRILSNEIVKSFLEVPDRWVSRVEMIIDELFNNAVEHGSNKKSLIKVIFEISINESLKIIVEDEGKGKKVSIKKIHEHILKHQKLGSSDVFSNSTVRGRGLAHIVTKWADSWEITKTKNGGMRFEIIINQQNKI